MKILLIENRPPAGFGSNLDVLLRATIALNRIGLTDIHYYWENLNYGAPGENLFEKYIKKQNPIDSGEEIKMAHAIQFAQDLLHYDLSIEQNNLLKDWGFFESELFKKVKKDAADTENAGVGIHIRNPINVHLVHPPLSTYFEWTERIIEKYNKKYSNQNLVLVTDQDSTIGAFKYVYGDKLKYNKKVFRTPFFLMGQHDTWPEWTDKFNLGYDFLLDAYLLSSCKEIIYAGSNIVTFAAALKPGNYYHQIPLKSLDADGGFENVKKLNKQARN